MTDEIKTKHKKEIKAFESEKRNALKKVKGTAGKGKKGKEKLEEAEKEWNQKYQTLLQKHEEELSSTQQQQQQQDSRTTETTTAESTQDTTNTTTNNNDPNKEEQPKSKEQLAKEKALAKKLRKKQAAILKEKQREEQIAYEIANAPNPRLIEINTLNELYLNKSNLCIEEVAADGNCLYRAVATQLNHQMNRNNIEQSGGSEFDNYIKVRDVCANELIKSKTEYEPFCEYNDSNVTTFEQYVEQVRSSTEWGGHLELRALSNALKKTIVVYSADSGPLYISCDESGGSKNNDDNDENLIRLSFHRNYYALGEHYNSVVKNVEKELRN